MTAATSVSRRHRKDHREAKQNHEDHLTALEHQILAEIAQRPAAAVGGPGERVPLRERPLLPVARPWMKDPKAEAKQAAKVAGNRVAHHGVRVILGDHPRTFLCAAGRGVRRAAVESREYVRMPKRLAVLTELVTRGAVEDHKKMAVLYDKIRKQRIQKARAAAGTVTGGLLASVILAVVFLGPWLAAVLFLAGAPSGFAVYGRKRKASPATVRVDTRPVLKIEGRPTADAIHQAFDHAGIKGVSIERAPSRVGPGYESLVKIPAGTDTFDTAVAKRKAIAGNLGVTTERLFLDPVKGDSGSEKHVLVWKADTDPMAGDPPPHPLLSASAPSWDVWTQGIPLGVDPRGKQVCFPVVDTPFGAIGALPTAGKTFAMFDVAVAVALDALFDMDCISFKASDDFKPLKPLVAACGGTYICGADEKAFEAFHRYLVRMRVELNQRYTRLGQLPIEVVPKGKVTRALAADARMGMRPRVVLVDEIQTALLHPKWGALILAELIDLARTARALHYWMLCGMQFVKADTVEALVSLLGFRFALSVARWEDSKGILGGAHTPGLADASEIPLSRKGVGIVAGAEDDPNLGDRPAFKMRTYGIDRTLLAEHTKRCLAGPRAGQGVPGRLSLAKDDDQVAEAFKARVRPVLNGDEALTCAALGERLELGQGPAAAKKLAEQARAAGIEPQRDTTGRVTGSREALYIHRDQLN